MLGVYCFMGKRKDATLLCMGMIVYGYYSALYTCFGSVAEV